MAGCVSDDGQDTDPATGDTPPDPPTVAERVMVYDCSPTTAVCGSTEAFVSVSPDGQTALTCTHGEFIQDSPSFVSQDGGESWRRVEFPPEVGVGGDCDTAIMPDGTWVFVLSTVEQTTVITTSDEGASFTWSNVASWPTNGMADRPWIEAAGDRLLLTFMPFQATPGWIGYTYSDNKAATWTVTEHITSWEGTHVSVVHGDIKVHADQERVWVPVMKYDQPSSPRGGFDAVTGVLGYVHSDDAGQTWTEVTLTPPMALGKQNPTLAVAGDRLYMVHHVPASGEAEPFVTPNEAWDVVAWISEDAGTTWSEPVTILEDISTVNLNWIDGASDGTATYLLQGRGEEFGYEEGNRSIGIRLDADVPGLIAYTQDFGRPGLIEFATVDHDAKGLAHVSYRTLDALWFTKEVRSQSTG